MGQTDRGEECMGRRLLSAIAGFTILVVMSAVAAEEPVVRVFNWTDYIDETVLADFTDRHQGRLRNLRLQRRAREQAACGRDRL